MDRAIQPSRALLGLVVRGLNAELSEKERSVHARESANFRGLLPHPGLRPTPLLEALAETIYSIIANTGTVIVIPDVARMDSESIDLIRPLLRRSPDGGLRFRIGLNTAYQPVAIYDQLRIAAIARELDTILLLRCAEQVVTAETAPAVCDSCSDPYDDWLEQRAWSRPGDLELNLAAARATFGAFGLPEAIEFAGRALGAGAEAGNAAEMHTIIGVCAHNLKDLYPFASYLKSLPKLHFDSALKLETEPRRLACLLSRMAIQYAGSDPAYARQLAGRGLDIARRLAPELAAFYEAWALNARAYAWYKESRLEQAAADCEQAVALLGAYNHTLALPAGETELTLWLLCDNLTRIALDRRSTPRAVRYQQLAAALLRQIEPWQRPVPSAFAAQTAGDDLADAVKRFETSLDRARQEFMPRHEAMWQHALGQIYYRQGAAGRAVGSFVSALEIWRRTQGFEEDITTALLNAMLAALRAGWGSEAESLAVELAARPGMEGPAIQAELHAARGLACALRGDVRASLAQVRIADRDSDVLGDPALAARIACLNARSAAALGLRSDGLWDHASNCIAAAGGPAAAGWALSAGMLLGRIENGAPADLLHRTAAHLFAALEEDDFEAWWDLPRFLRLAVETKTTGFETVPGWDRLLRCARERLDCQSDLAIFNAASVRRAMEEHVPAATEARA